MRNHPYGFEIYLVNVKTMRTIAQIVVAFSEKLNFTLNLRRFTCKNSSNFVSTMSLYEGQKLARASVAHLAFGSYKLQGPKVFQRPRVGTQQGFNNPW